MKVNVCSAPGCTKLTTGEWCTKHWEEHHGRPAPSAVSGQWSAAQKNTARAVQATPRAPDAPQPQPTEPAASPAKPVKELDPAERQEARWRCSSTSAQKLANVAGKLCACGSKRQEGFKKCTRCLVIATE